MSRSIPRPHATAVLAAGTALLLTGCAAVQGFVGGVEPERDEATGAVTEAVQADAFALRVGDCLTINETMPVSDEVEDVESVPTVPCDEEHDSEIYAAHLMDDAEFPGEDAVAATADELCYDDFQAFVGTAYEDSTLDFTTFFPSGDSWKLMDDREILCIVVDPAGGVTGSLKGAQH